MLQLLLQALLLLLQLHCTTTAPLPPPFSVLLSFLCPQVVQVLQAMQGVVGGAGGAGCAAYIDSI